MSTSEAAKLLSDPIRSEEEFNAVLARMGVTTAATAAGYGTAPVQYGIDHPTSGITRVPLVTPSGGPCLTLHRTKWWVAREWARYWAGVYTINPALAPAASQFGAMAIHNAVGSDDKSMVAYTPDEAAGVRDKQVVTTLGRLLHKLYPHIADDAIRDIEAAHRSEMSDEVEFITGADEIVAAYTAINSCMGKPADYWDGLDKHHPVEVYDAPGFAVAVVRNAKGEISARAVVFVNPDDPDDKRYARIYGDATLELRLRRRGFRHAGLAGARVKRVDLPGDATATTIRVLMPYVDMGPTSVANAVAFCDDPRYLVLLDASAALAIARAIGAPASMAPRVAAGALSVDRRFNVSALSVTCPITGTTFSAAETAPIDAFVDGRAVLAHPSSERHAEGWAWRTGLVNGSWRTVLARSDAPTIPGTLTVDTPEARLKLGMRLLSERLYGPGQWVSGKLASLVDYDVVLRKDVVLVITRDGDGDIVQQRRFGPHFLSEKKAQRRRYVPVVPLGLPDTGRVVRTFADTTAVQTAALADGRVVVENVHNVVRDSLSGRLMMAGLARGFRAFGVWWAVPKSHPSGDVDFIEGRLDYVADAFRAALDALDRHDISNYDAHLSRVVVGRLVDGWELRSAHADSLAGLADEVAVIRAGQLPPPYSSFQRVSRLVKPLFVDIALQVHRQWELARAEEEGQLTVAA